MSVTQILPLAAAVVAPLVERLAEGVSQGVSFASVLANGSLSASAGNAGEETQPAGEKNQLLDSLPSVGGEHLSQMATRQLEQFLGTLRERLASGQIDTSLAFDLKASAGGEVIVDGNHPQRAEIESLFRQDPTLVSEFRQLAAAYTAVERQANPGALQQREFRLSIIGGQAAVRFE